MSGSFPRLAQRTPDSVDSTTTTTAGPENPAAVADVTLPKRASSLVSSILHGSPKAKQEARDTFSRLLARGKYVHEICEHSVKPDCHDEYVALISDFYPRLTRDMNPRVKLCGSWQTDVGRLDNFVHIWEYEGYPAHGELLHQLKTNSEYLEFQRHCMKLLARRNSQIMLEFAFWPTSPPVTTHGVYELRSYRLKPGNLLEWESNWRKGIECRKGLEHPIGAWFSQLGGLNQVHHMWAYPDLETRKRAREEAWSNDAWAQTVYNTVRLIDEMHASILSPLPFSPLK
ncbi:hypothetical protein BJ085DRAFT_20206 [Dimargaris cristalligena]|uniref:NIPSNAP domain-containing protein n=1 Tax=Dimargaris cristalligena TaxID=215637 RepID=A0A4P9ZUU9_9FUNG|nr:hypothetical protein BJ085DRAFT_20206 [Dimargaris cristalligena]|eukprot:RKP37335.1 hypothetical protein BJ085DRAFT_20206 [Dimargaris cristalligena]